MTAPGHPFLAVIPQIRYVTVPSVGRIMSFKRGRSDNFACPSMTFLSLATFGLTIALAENACDNGVEFQFLTEVETIEKEAEGYVLKTSSLS